jgi:hypothetical protein
VATGKQALAEFRVDEAKAALADAEHRGPLDHTTHVSLWEQRGIAAAYASDPPTAIAAFDMLLALDPGHLLSYTLSPQVTFVFEQARTAAGERGSPAIDVRWSQGQRIGAPVTLDVEVVSDPRTFLRSASVFVRRRGEPSWRAADLALPAPGKVAQLTLPAVGGSAASALEIHARAYDAAGNEVLAWADPRRPREIPLRYDPPPPWWRKWYVIVPAALGALAISGGIVYAATREPPSTIDTPIDF